MIVSTIPSKTYIVTSAGACTVTLMRSSGEAVTLTSVGDSGGQCCFVAAGTQVEVSDDRAVVVALPAASFPDLCSFGNIGQFSDKVYTIAGIVLPDDTELHYGDEVILIPDADSIDLSAAFASVVGTYAVKITLINEAEDYLLVRDGDQMLCLVKPHSQIDGVAVRSDEALHVSVDQGAISEQTFTPDGTDEDVITLSDDGKTCIISWPNRMWSSQTIRYDLFPNYVKADDVEIFAPHLLSGNSLLSQIVPGSRTGTVRAYLPELRSAQNFCYITHFSKWVGDLPKLEDGTGMFRSSIMTSFEGDVSHVKTGNNMFDNSGIFSWDGDFPELTSATSMFSYMINMTSFRSKMLKVTASSSLLLNSTKLVSVEISAPKQTATSWFGTSPIETLRLSIPSFQKLDFSTSGIGACTPLETLEIFEDTDADGVMHAGLETCTTIKFYATHTSLSAVSVQNIVDAAADWSASSGVSALMQMPAGKLTEEQKSALTAKGWTYSEV